MVAPSNGVRSNRNTIEYVSVGQSKKASKRCDVGRWRMRCQLPRSVAKENQRLAMATGAMVGRRWRMILQTVFGGRASWRFLLDGVKSA